LRSFERAVIDEAKSLGLTKPRWPPRVVSALGLLAAAAFILVALATDEGNGETLLRLATAGLAMATIAASSYIFRETAQLVTPAGLGVQARWLALRKYLHDDELFP